MTGALGICLALALSTANPSGPSAESVIRSLSSLQAGGFDPTPGRWIVFRIGPEPYRYMRLAVLQTEATRQGEGHWLEVGLGSEPTGGAIGMKLLAVGDPRSGLNLVRVLYRLGMGSTAELDQREVEHLRRGAPSGPPAQASPALRPDQFEDLTTFAGVFHCARLDLPGGKFWLAAEAPVFHLAKASLTDGTTLELFAAGAGATDSVGDVADAGPGRHAEGGRP